MDKKFILEHRKEFDHWLNNGKLLVRSYNYEDKKYSDWYSSHNVYSDYELWQNSIYKPQIIIDDEYVELRKALIEGKTIQHNASYLYSRNEYWIDLQECSFPAPVKTYRIKPDQPKF